MKAILLVTLLVACVYAAPLHQLLENKAAEITAPIENQFRERTPVSCPGILTCVATGGNCTVTTNSAGKLIIPTCTGSFCGTNSVCAALKANGVACGDDDECQSGVCTSGTCASVSLTANGGSCLFSSACQSGLCVSGKCVADVYDKCSANGDCETNICTAGRCIPVAIGQSCSSGRVCGALAYCSSSGTCTAVVALGQTCTSGDQCGAFGTCAPTTSSGNLQCRSPYSAGSGAYCSSTNQCGDNLQCVGYNVLLSTYGTCQATSSSLKACSDTDDCTNGEQCQCSYVDGTSSCRRSVVNNPAGLSSAYTDLQNCARSNCGASSTSDACLSDKCGNQYCKAYNLAVNSVVSILKPFYPSCIALATLLPCSSAASLAAGAVTIVAAVFALLF